VRVSNDHWKEMDNDNPEQLLETSSQAVYAAVSMCHFVWEATKRNFT
jgi:hypothetical protein